MDDKKRIVIIGATSTIALHCARLWTAHEPVILTLVGRDKIKLAQSAADLKVRNPQTVIEIVELNFLDPLAIKTFVTRIMADAALDLVLIAHGMLPEQNVCQQDLKYCYDVLAINAISPVLFAEAFAESMQTKNYGTLAIIGSVAGDRGRKSNYIYGAAKGLIERYTQGLQHRFAGSKVKVVLIKPGPTKTSMTAHLEQKVEMMADPEDVARVIVNGIKKGQKVIYAPAKWAVIMLVIRNIPNCIFNKMRI